VAHGAVVRGNAAEPVDREKLVEGFGHWTRITQTASVVNIHKARDCGSL
jgi:hypothetical protein